MKISLNTRKVVIIFVIILIICLAVFCCIMTRYWDSNLVSMISGLWSALATFVVGIIAFCQSKRYKKLADESEERHDKPEFYIPTPINSLGKISKATFNTTVFYGSHQKDCLFSERDFLFSSLDKPIINLYALYLIIDDKRQNLSIKHPNGIDIFEKNSGFYVELKNCNPLSDGKHNLEMGIQFENIYGTKYQKKYYSEISITNNKIVSHSLGTLSKAEKIN